MLILEHFNFREDNSFPFGTFGLHPLLMVTAFGLCSPVAMVSYKTYEYLLGLSHSTVKALHALLQTAALLIGGVGMASMWETHKDARHFQTAHSWIGLAGFIAFSLNWVLGMAVFLNPCCPGRIRGALLQPHIVLGTVATVLTLLALASGPLALVQKPVGTAPGFSNNSAEGKPLGTDVSVWELGNAAALCGCGVLVFLVLTMSEAGRIRLGHKQSGSSP